MYINIPPRQHNRIVYNSDQRDRKNTFPPRVDRMGLSALRQSPPALALKKAGRTCH